MSRRVELWLDDQDEPDCYTIHNTAAVIVGKTNIYLETIHGTQVGYPLINVRKWFIHPNKPEKRHAQTNSV